MLIIGASISLVMLTALVYVATHCLLLEKNSNKLRFIINKGVNSYISLLSLFLLISLLTSSLILSGTIPAIVYYGIHYLSPGYFLPIGMLLCSISSLLIGSCWGTIGTIGIALSGIGTYLKIPHDVTAGMIISGAYFGDKISPLSDTTLLTTIINKVQLNKHIQGMVYLTLPTYLICLMIFYYIGKQYAHNTFAYSSDIQTLSEAIHHHFKISIFSLIPIVVIVFLSMRKLSIHATILITAISAILLSLLYQNQSVLNVLKSIFWGLDATPFALTRLNTLFHYGGLTSTFPSISLTIIVLTIATLLNGYNYSVVLIKNLIKLINNKFSLNIYSLLTPVVINVLIGEAYFSILLTSKVFQKVFKKFKLPRYLLSNITDLSSTLSAPVIPWTTSGIFTCSALLLDDNSYIFWCIFNWLTPLYFIIVTLSQALFAKYKHRYIKDNQYY